MPPGLVPPSLTMLGSVSVASNSAGAGDRRDATRQWRRPKRWQQRWWRRRRQRRCILQSEAEHARFLQGVAAHDNAWGNVQRVEGSRTRMRCAIWHCACSTPAAP